ncbi:hypothetical protein F511_40284 [Dorcoceras hygrometricum]|uniref:Uncharacterized protein n=1 Tax=Dorcoceras hygrometricum TaxID=472368 RepID=A0A2Z7BPZ7_9LAMI|nr:hypothetical protein F511_40284 [Dorcoceras hygrometricum]
MMTHCICAGSGNAKLLEFEAFEISLCKRSAASVSFWVSNSCSLSSILVVNACVEVSESTVRRPGKAPEGAVPSPSPGRHAVTRSRRASSSTSSPTADGFGTGTPMPSPQSQSFSRGYGSILPTSLAYIVSSTRGCSPWRPDAVMSTTGRGRHSVLRIFKGRRGCTGHHATCGALPAAGPYLRLSRFQGGQAICTDGRSARARALGFAATAAPSYSSGPVPCPDGRVSAQLDTVTRLPVHPASPVLLTKNGPLGALDSMAWLNGASTPSYLFKSFAPIPKSDEQFARQYRCGPPPEFPLASPRSGIVHHLSGPDRYAHSNPSQKIKPVDSHTCQTPWSVFQDGSNGEPTGQHREHAVAEARLMARAVRHDRGDGIPRAYQLPGLWPPTRSVLVHTPSRSADRLSPFHIRPGRIAGPHPLPSRQFQALFDSLFKVLFIFPSRYLFAIGLSPVFSLGRNLPPDWGCIPKQPDSPTAPRGATGSGHDGALTLSGAPFQGTWARSAAEDASPDYNSNDVVARFSSWAIPGSLAVTKGILMLLITSWLPRTEPGRRGDRFGFPWRLPRRDVVTNPSYDNDPSAGSPTETLLRLLLPLNDKVQWTSRYVAGSEPPTSERSEHFTGPFNR